MVDLNLQADTVRFLMAIDADARVDAMSITHMVYGMDKEEKEEKVLALRGETKVDNKASSSGDGILHEHSRNDVETPHEKNPYRLGVGLVGADGARRLCGEGGPDSLWLREVDIERRLPPSAHFSGGARRRRRPSTRPPPPSENRRIRTIPSRRASSSSSPRRLSTLPSSATTAAGAERRLPRDRVAALPVVPIPLRAPRGRRAQERGGCLRPRAGVGAHPQQARRGGNGAVGHGDVERRGDERCCERGVAEGPGPFSSRAWRSGEGEEGPLRTEEGALPPSSPIRRSRPAALLSFASIDSATASLAVRREGERMRG